MAAHEDGYSDTSAVCRRCFADGSGCTATDVRSISGEAQLRRKGQRARALLAKHEGVTTVCQSPNLYVANGGLGNGVSREYVLSVFAAYGAVTEIVMKPAKPYAFVCYAREDEAVHAQKAENGRRHWLRGCRRCGVKIGGTSEHVGIGACTETPATSTVDDAPASAACVTFYVSFVAQVPGVEPWAGLGQHWPSKADLPAGLDLLEDFISRPYETALLESIDWHSCIASSGQTLRHRQVRHYGYEFSYVTNNVDISCPLPEAIPTLCDDLLNRLRCLGHISQRPDQLTVNKYEPGQGIPPHVDTHSAFEDTIVVLSLGSQIVMDFWLNERHVPVVLPPRSVLLLSSESRYAWSHGIASRKSDIMPAQAPATGLTLVDRGVRVSFTFRKVRGRLCDCPYPAACDSQNHEDGSRRTYGGVHAALSCGDDGVHSALSCEVESTAAVPQPSDSTPLPPQLAAGAPERVSEDDACRLESRYVHEVYERIAGHFSDTRHTQWPLVTEFLQNVVQPGDLVADVGCGNGKYLAHINGAFKLGFEYSSGLAQICRSKGFNVCVADALRLPLQSDAVDVCVCIAVLHHLSTEERRLRAVQEMRRVVRHGGRLLLYVWAAEQELENVRSNYLKPGQHRAAAAVTAAAPATTAVMPAVPAGPVVDNEWKLPVHVNRTPFQARDLLVPWHLREGEAKVVTSHGSSSSSNAQASGQTPCVAADGKQSTVGGCSVPPFPSAAVQVHHRYYHVFARGELELLCRKAGGLSVVDSYYDKGNWCVSLVKE